jgi:hypothetical protein
MAHSQISIQAQRCSDRMRQGRAGIHLKLRGHCVMCRDTPKERKDAKLMVEGSSFVENIIFNNNNAWIKIYDCLSYVRLCQAPKRLTHVQDTCMRRVVVEKCSFMCIYIYIYVCVCIYLFVYLVIHICNLYIYLFGYACTYVYRFIPIHIYIWSHMYTYVYIYR